MNGGPGAAETPIRRCGDSWMLLILFKSRESPYLNQVESGEYSCGIIFIRLIMRMIIVQILNVQGSMLNYPIIFLSPLET